MERLKNNVVCKVVAFIVIQICVIVMVFSGVIVAANAGLGWYSAGQDTVRKEIMNEVAYDFQSELHDRLYYNIEFYESDYAVWHEYFQKNDSLPEGIGYKLEILKEYDHEFSDIALEKNFDISKSDSAFTSDIYNDTYRLTVCVADPMEAGKPVTEIYPEKQAMQYQFYYMMYQYNKIAIAGFLLGLVLFVLLFIFIVSSMKCEAGMGGILKKLPVDMVGCICAGAGIAAVICFIEAPVSSFNYDLVVLCTMAVTFVISVAITSFVMFFIYRVKCGKWWHNAVIAVLLKFVKRSALIFLKYIKKAVLWACVKIKLVFDRAAGCIRKIPVIWKTVVALIVFWCINLLIAVNFYWSDAFVVLWILSAFLVSAVVMYIALCMKHLQKGGRKLAEGDLSYKIETKGLFLDFAEHAENLNKIGGGMAAAVEERIKSERFKAELITNVSHDIKTPLTSIINYVDLLHKKEIEDSEIREYIDVLERQSKRLKKLTEDIVDASKASTGNVKMEIAPCKIGLLMSQTIGEYRSKAEDTDLELVIKMPEEELEILADGRRLWRVFDNLLNNVCKYGQPGTRVYISLEEVDGKAVITYRNISKYELDISEKDLMERFVRGDRSRHTEGSGLGLSIARNLVELQGGSFDMSIDGDLFKVRIIFDLLKL